MDHLLNFLAGLGSALGAFGTSPQYKLPSIGDRAIDASNLRRDVRSTRRDLNKTANKALEERYGKIDHSATAQ